MALRNKGPYSVTDKHKHKVYSKSQKFLYTQFSLIPLYTQFSLIPFDDSLEQYDKLMSDAMISDDNRR